MSASRFVLGLEGPELLEEERAFLAANAPFGVILFARNLENPLQAARLIAEVRALSTPSPLLFVDQEGGTVDRIGPLLGIRFPSSARTAELGLDRVHENAYLMGRAARLLGFDVDFAPVLDLRQPRSSAVILEGRTFGLFQEDVIACGMVFLHGLARAGIASCLKHFPGLGRGDVDSHIALPVIEAEDVDLLVNDVAPFAKLAKNADGVLVAHASYPKLGDAHPASQSSAVHRILREKLGFTGIVYSDDLLMGALTGTPVERATAAAEAGCDVLVVSRGVESYESCVEGVAALGEDPARESRLMALRARCADAPRRPFTVEAWSALEDEAKAFLEMLDRPRAKRVEMPMPGEEAGS